MSELFANLGLNGKLLFAQGLNFLIVLYVLNRFVFKKLIVFLEERKERIEKGVELTEKAEVEMERVAEVRKSSLQLAKKTATELIAKVKGQSDILAKEIEGDAREKSEDILNKALEQAKKEQSSVIASAKNEINRMAALAIEKVLQRSLTEKDEELLAKEVTDYLDKEYVK